MVSNGHNSNQESQVTDATFDGGVLRPDRALRLREHERVRLIVQRLESTTAEARASAMARLRAGIASMGFRSNTLYPTRDELHDRD